MNSQSGNNTYAGLVSIGSGGATIASTSTAAGDGLTLSGGINNTILGRLDASHAHLRRSRQHDGQQRNHRRRSDQCHVDCLDWPGGSDPQRLEQFPRHCDRSRSVDPPVDRRAGQFGWRDGLVDGRSGTQGINGTTGTGVPLSLSGTGTNAVIPGTATYFHRRITDVGTNGYGGAISLPTDATIATTSGTDVLTLSGAIAIGTGGMSQTLTFIGPGKTSVTGPIADATQSVLGSVVVNATPSLNGGSVTFAGPNTYHGTTTVNTGALLLSNNTALGNTSSPVTVASGIRPGDRRRHQLESAFARADSRNGLPITLSIAGTGRPWHGRQRRDGRFDRFRHD